MARKRTKYNKKHTKTRKRTKRMYAMKGCSRKGGGGGAYTGQPEITQPNPFLAYQSGGDVYPNTGPPFINGANTIYNNASPMRGGGDSKNYIPLNTYHTDVSRQMRLNGGKRRKSKKQRAGGLSNLMSQDLVNVGRQMQFGMSSAYNGIAGLTPPVNPLPWKGQFPTSTPLNPALI